MRFSHSPFVTQNKSRVSHVSQQIHSSPVEACALLLADLSTQEPQLLINYPSQENLQEIKNTHQKAQPTDQEISQYLQNEKQYPNRDQFFYRSQSVPLHRMVNPALLSPISIHHLTPNFFNHSFNASNDSSIPPTPVPSEFNDFCSVTACDNSNFLLDVDPLAPPDQQFLMEDKETIPENLNNIFDILTKQGSGIMQHDSTIKQTTLDVNSLVMPNENISDNILLADSNALIDPWPNQNVSSTKSNGQPLSDSVSKMLHSRSYPNTPAPVPATNSSISVQYSKEGIASKSYPATPIHNLHREEFYSENNEPMLFNPDLSTPSFQNQTMSSNTTCSTSVECSVADFFLNRDLTTDGTDDLGSLSNFDGLQDVDALSPLFTEVVETNY
ncbi:hypothetical protein QAD02_004051 [Eretmocerus hayati]|uniref:Uncharacterized protein n=1 Tax=Eretmocerus hayati TaxID=131215 RepID=A0ACC2NQ97_9HYME|nr:hypothetical protein QAD02_004051 [Eretmocerus hayati]